MTTYHGAGIIKRDSAVGVIEDDNSVQDMTSYDRTATRRLSALLLAAAFVLSSSTHVVSEAMGGAIVAAIALVTYATSPKAPRFPKSVLAIIFVAFVSAVSLGLQYNSGELVIQMTIYAFAGSLVSKNLSLNDVIRTLVAASIILAVVSLAIGAVLPATGLHASTFTHPYALRGIYEHKNALGFRMTIGVSALLFSLIYRRSCMFTRSIFLNVTIVTIFAVTIEKVDNATASSSAIGALLMFLFYKISQSLAVSARRASALVLIIVSAITLAVSRSTFIAVFYRLAGRDASLTGRTEVWERALSLWEESPLFGIGFGTTRLSDAPDQVVTILRDEGYAFAHLHSGIVTILVELGLIGVILLTAIYVAPAISAIRVARAGGDPAFVWILCVVMILILRNMVEANLWGLPLFLLVLCNNFGFDAQNRIKCPPAGESSQCCAEIDSAQVVGE
jgi:O-antigen ligase